MCVNVLYASYFCCNVRHTVIHIVFVLFPFYLIQFFLQSITYGFYIRFFFLAHSQLDLKISGFIQFYKRLFHSHAVFVKYYRSTWGQLNFVLQILSTSLSFVHFLFKQSSILALAFLVSITQIHLICVSNMCEKACKKIYKIYIKMWMCGMLIVLKAIHSHQVANCQLNSYVYVIPYKNVSIGQFGWLKATVDFPFCLCRLYNV